MTPTELKLYKVEHAYLVARWEDIGRKVELKESIYASPGMGEKVRQDIRQRIIDCEGDPNMRAYLMKFQNQEGGYEDRFDII